MLRPGRLDRLLCVELPTPPERHNILHTISTRNKTPLAPDVDLKAIAENPRLEGFSGADLASLVRESAVGALRETLYAVSNGPESNKNDDETTSPNIVVRQEHFLAALGRIAPSVPEKDRKMYARMKEKLGGKAPPTGKSMMSGDRPNRLTGEGDDNGGADGNLNM